MLPITGLIELSTASSARVPEPAAREAKPPRKRCHIPDAITMDAAACAIRPHVRANARGLRDLRQAPRPKQKAAEGDLELRLDSRARAARRRAR